MIVRSTAAGQEHKPPTLNTPIEKDTTKVTETDTPTAIPMDEPTAAVHGPAAGIDDMKDRIGLMHTYMPVVCSVYHCQ